MPGDPLEIQQSHIFRPGPALIAQPWVRGGEASATKSGERDVTDRAHEFLFETIEMDSRVTLADLFRLLDKDPTLKRIFRRDWAEELCAEARRGAVEPSSPNLTWNEGIEYLELSQEWHLDTSNNTYLPMQRLQLHGIGVELAEDAPEHHLKKGERITWAVSLTPVRELLALPLRLSSEVVVREDDVDSQSYGNELSRARHDTTLGQIISGVLGRLRFTAAAKSRPSSPLSWSVAQVRLMTGRRERTARKNSSGNLTSREWTRCSTSWAAGRHAKSGPPCDRSETMRTPHRGSRMSSAVPSS